MWQAAVYDTISTSTFLSPFFPLFLPFLITFVTDCAQAPNSGKYSPRNNDVRCGLKASFFQQLC